MTALLVALTVVEVLLLVGVLLVYLRRVRRSLRSAARTFGQVSFGVRAIERQLSGLGGGLEELNAGLDGITRRVVGSTERGRG